MRICLVLIEIVPKAKVTYNCLLEKDLEHIIPKSSNWFKIDKNGEEIN